MYTVDAQNKPILKREHCNGPVPDGFQAGQPNSAELYIRDVVISKMQGNNCAVMIADDVALVRNILHYREDTCLVVDKFCTVTDSYTYPIASSILGIYEVSVLSKKLHVASVSEFKSKYVI